MINLIHESLNLLCLFHLKLVRTSHLLRTGELDVKARSRL